MVSPGQRRRGTFFFSPCDCNNACTHFFPDFHRGQSDAPPGAQNGKCFTCFEICPVVQSEVSGSISNLDCRCIGHAHSRWNGDASIAIKDAKLRKSTLATINRHFLSLMKSGYIASQFNNFSAEFQPEGKWGRRRVLISSFNHQKVSKIQAAGLYAQ